MTEKAYQHYLRDLGTELREQALQAKIEALSGFQGPNEDYHLGRVMAYYTVIALMQDQAEVFGIDYEDVGLAGFDPDKELLIKRPPASP